MIAHRDENLQVFLNIHHDELDDARIARTGLFSDYVSYCKHKGATYHSNLVQFCKECATLADATQRQLLH